MKAFFLIVLLFSNGAMALTDCEATIEEGQHWGHSKQEAIEAAWEEAVDNCYPGKVERLSAHCTAITEEENTSFRCTQEVSCTTCGEDLVRKYEALD
ncbi:hypothetical protein ACU6U9_08250 [Pseudomonas sp. HK3]